MANLLTRAMSWPALVFTFATWVVFLAGIACLQHNCYDGTTGQGTAQVPTGSLPNNLNTLGTSGVWGWSGNVLPCTRLFRFYWFMIAFTFIIIVGALIATGPKYGLHSSRPFWVGMFSINTLLYMIASEAMLAALDVNTFSGGQYQNCMRTAAAGAIMTVVGSIFLLLTVGTDWENRASYGEGHGKHGVGRRDEGTGLPVANPAGAATGPVTYTGQA